MTRETMNIISKKSLSQEISKSGANLWASEVL